MERAVEQSTCTCIMCCLHVCVVDVCVSYIVCGERRCRLQLLLPVMLWVYSFFVVAELFR